MAESADFLINRRPAAGILLLVSCIFVADGGKLGLPGEDLLEVEPLVCRVQGMVFWVVRNRLRWPPHDAIGGWSAMYRGRWCQGACGGAATSPHR